MERRRRREEEEDREQEQGSGRQGRSSRSNGTIPQGLRHPLGLVAAAGFRRKLTGSRPRHRASGPWARLSQRGGNQQIGGQTLSAPPRGIPATVGTPTRYRPIEATVITVICAVPPDTCRFQSVSTQVKCMEIPATASPDKMSPNASVPSVFFLTFLLGIRNCFRLYKEGKQNPISCLGHVATLPTHSFQNLRMCICLAALSSPRHHKKDASFPVFPGPSRLHAWYMWYQHQICAIGHPGNAIVRPQGHSQDRAGVRKVGSGSGARGEAAAARGNVK